MPEEPSEEDTNCSEKHTRHVRSSRRAACRSAQRLAGISPAPTVRSSVILELNLTIGGETHERHARWAMPARISPVRVGRRWIKGTSRVKIEELGAQHHALWPVARSTRLGCHRTQTTKNGSAVSLELSHPRSITIMLRNQGLCDLQGPLALIERSTIELPERGTSPAANVEYA